MTWMIALSILQSAAWASPVQCKARVALNRYYSVEVDRDTRGMKVTSDGGGAWSGTVSHYDGSREEAFHFPLYIPYENTSYYPSGMTLRIDKTDNSMLLCLRTSECYICR